MPTSEKLDFKNPEIRLNSFDSYVTHHGHGITVEQAREKAGKGARFLQDIQNNIPPKGTKEENMANLVWFMTARSYGDPYMIPIDNGMYTISLEGTKATQRLNDYFAGPQAKSYPTLRAIAGIVPGLLSIPINFLVSIKRLFIPAAPGSELPGFSGLIDGIAKLFGKRGPAFDPQRTAYGRASSHFKKSVKNHFGYDIRNAENTLSGKFNTVVFGLVETPGQPTRLYFKPEEAGIDLLHHPGDSAAHTASFLGVHKADVNEVSAKEKFVHNKDILDKYSELMGIEAIGRKESNKGKLNLDKMRQNITNHYAGSSLQVNKLNEFENVVTQTHAKDTIQSGGENACHLTSKNLQNFVTNRELIDKKIKTPATHHEQDILIPLPSQPLPEKAPKVELVTQSPENESKTPKKIGGP